jgi:Stress responsive A/B Barrel Domain
MKSRLLILTLCGIMAPRLAMPNTPAKELANDEKAVGIETFTSVHYKPGMIRHIVIFKYRDSVTSSQKDEVRRRFLALKDEAKINGKRYIRSIESGDQMSGEGADRGLEQIFLVTFCSEGSRNYYVGTPIINNPNYYDPAHADFKDFVGPLLSDVVVVDYRVKALSGASSPRKGKLC